MRELDYRLESFNLSEHGDRLERRLWPYVRNDFPLYEVLWRRYVVPLTRRLECHTNPSLQIRLRPEMKHFELFVMSHYSVFWYFAHATKRLSSRQDQDLLASNFFYLMDTSIDNLKTFLKQLRKIGKLIDINFDFVEPENDTAFLELKEITNYRDTIVHNPVLGRSVGRGVELLPVHSELDKAKRSWLYCEFLPDDKYVNTRDLLETYRSRYARYLNQRWETILCLLEENRDKFVRRLRLQESSPIAVKRP